MCCIKYYFCFQVVGKREEHRLPCFLSFLRWVSFSEKNAVKRSFCNLYWNHFIVASNKQHHKVMSQRLMSCVSLITKISQSGCICLISIVSSLADVHCCREGGAGQQQWWGQTPQRCLFLLLLERAWGAKARQPSCSQHSPLPLNVFNVQNIIQSTF